jgi:hypothetical protein
VRGREPVRPSRPRNLRLYAEEGRAFATGEPEPAPGPLALEHAPPPWSWAGLRRRRHG